MSCFRNAGDYQQEDMNEYSIKQGSVRDAKWRMNGWMDGWMEGESGLWRKG